MRADLVVKSVLFNRAHTRILLLRRSDEDPTGADTWENAGGNIEPGETPEAALRREIREETGLTAAVQRIAYATIVSAEPPFLILAYLCEAETDAVALSAEHRDFLWADAAQCRALLPQPILDDFTTNGVFQLFR